MKPRHKKRPRYSIGMLYRVIFEFSIFEILFRASQCSFEQFSIITTENCLRLDCGNCGVYTEPCAFHAHLDPRPTYSSLIAYHFLIALQISILFYPGFDRFSYTSFLSLSSVFSSRPPQIFYNLAHNPPFLFRYSAYIKK